MYNWQYKAWPEFSYTLENIQVIAVAFAEELGQASGLITALNDGLKQETIIEILIAEAIKTSEIEGEYMSRVDVMSSIKRNLGLKDDTKVRDIRVAGIAQLMTNVRQAYKKELSVTMILEWHKMLMESFTRIQAGQWRAGHEPMQVISGAHGKEIVHYEAPPSARVAEEMNNFVEWFNNTVFSIQDKVSQSLVRSAITHLYFESIHPFEDGNGRIGRALAEYALSYTLQSPVLLSISKVIEKNKTQYYNALKSAQSTLEISAWIEYFAKVILEAQIEAKLLVEFIVKKAKFFDKFKAQLNERELKAINRMFASGVEGFEGGMTAKKYVVITKASKATATRDLQHLSEIGALSLLGAGRSVRYELVL
ncbi:Fic family protein [Sphingobacterium nematocida]|uniref:Fic family protein n=1 Tax=Sphingobacterium nematocida TaxID=1513896 RepID=A0A1T5B282_9SPHI|nr:Fic family protein [Sphingobacterium nematocida]SKB41167.1 Fic family protein [Sphingobacterium nematocida]